MSTDTTTLLVQSRQLSGIGPSDIVGAAINEAGVSPDAIGAIDLDDGAATVEVDDDVGDTSTVAVGAVFDAFIRYAEEEGHVVRPVPTEL